MKKKSFKLLAIALMLIGAGMSLVSCNDEPKKPGDESEHKHHDDPYKAVLTLATGHFHGDWFHQDEDAEGVQYLKAVQTITFVDEGKGWAPEKGSQKGFVVRAGEKDEEAPYFLTIRYFAKDGDEITGHFVENNQDQIHQHFFIPTNVKPFEELGGKVEADDTDPAKIYDYTYMDTNPWNKTLKDEGTTLIGKTNPIGFKGYFNFLKNHKIMTVAIRLMHARTSKFINDKASPFYAPTPGQLASDHWDVKMDIPVMVYAEEEAVHQWKSELGTSYENLTEEEQKLINSIAVVYGIDKKAALDDFYIFLKHRLEHHHHHH